MKSILLALLFTLPAIAAENCPAHPLCEQLDTVSLECENKWDEKTCNQFVEIFEKLVDEKVCQRSAVISCADRPGGAYSDLKYDRLAKLPYKSAIKLYTSEKLRKTMDGAIAESHLKKSKKDQARLGKTLFPTKMIPECRELEDVPFVAAKMDVVVKGKPTIKGYDYSKAVIGDYEIQSGDTPKKILNTKTQKACSIDNHLSIDRVQKIPESDMVLIKSSTETSKHFDTLYDLKTCKKIWESSWTLLKGVAGETSHKITVNNLKKSAWKKCSGCWSNEYEGCLRRF